MNVNGNKKRIEWRNDTLEMKTGFLHITIMELSKAMIVFFHQIVI